MDQINFNGPIDFSKKSNLSTKSKSIPNVRNQLDFNRLKAISNYSNNLENSDGNTSRSSTSSPDSLSNDQLAQSNNLNMLASIPNTNFNFNQQLLMNNDQVNLLSNYNQLNLAGNHLNDTISVAAAVIGNLINPNQASNNHQLLNQFFSQPLSNQLNSSIFNSSLNQSSNSMIKKNDNSSNNDQFTSSSTPNQQVKNKSAQKVKSATRTKAVPRKSIIMNRQESILNENSKDDKFTNLQITTSFNLNSSNEENSNLSNLSAFSQNNDLSMVSPSSQLSVSGRRRRGQPIPDHLKDSNYWNKRVKNNYAAKKSRDQKREKDMETARRCCQLETENGILKTELEQIKNENLILRTLLGDEVFYDEKEKQQIDDLLLAGRKIDSNKIREFATEFTKTFGILDQQKMDL